METKQQSIPHIAHSDIVASNRDKKHAQTPKNQELTAHLDFFNKISHYTEICVG